MFAEYGTVADETIEYLPESILLTGRDGGAADLDDTADERIGFSLQPSAVDATWTNPEDIHDVNGDDQVTPLDAIVVVNAMRRSGGSIGLPPGRPNGENFLDVNGDGQVTALVAGDQSYSSQCFRR